MKTGAHELWIEFPVNENRCTWVMNRVQVNENRCTWDMNGVSGEWKQVHLSYEYRFQWIKAGAHEIWIEVPVNDNRCTWDMNRGSS